MRRRPRRLRRGDVVAVVAPAGPVPDTLLARGVQLLESWGLRVRVGDRVLASHPELNYLAGTDAERAEDFTNAWCDPDVAAVFCARGGYGCLRMVDLLDIPAVAGASPKVLVGSSDVTVLHERLAAGLGLPTLFAPMIATGGLQDHPTAAERLRRALFEPDADPLGRGHDPLRPGRAHGVLTGGNVSLLAATLDVAPPAGAIALLEEITEEPYRLDRILTQLLRAGWFANVAGIALGSFTDCGPLGEVRAVVSDRLIGLGVPIAWEVGFGHCTEAITVPLGVPATLDAEAGTLTPDGPALA
ncbi:MAG: S66 peptidase family protein [Sciscionella sp.]